MVAVALGSLFTMVADVAAQSLGQRIQHVRDQQARQHAARPEDNLDGASYNDGLRLSDRLGAVVREVHLDQVRLQGALDWWSRVTGVPMVADWNALSLEGVDSEKRITLNLRAVPADQLLGMILKMAEPEDAELTPGPMLLWDRTPWYIEVLTRGMANRRVVTRVYIVEDLTMEIPNFDDAPSFDLSQVLSSKVSQGGGSSTGLFNDANRGKRPGVSKEERGEQLATLIRDTIEPDIWIENGGQYASVRYFQGRLVVTAPQYVQRQIGLPSIILPDPYTTDAAAPSASSGVWGDANFHANAPVTGDQRGGVNPHAGVTAVGRADTDHIGGVRD
jgi:hypothetical protein